MRTENPTSLLHFELGPLHSSPMCGHHSTGWAARHMHVSLKVRTEFPTLFLHSKLGIVVKPGRRFGGEPLTDPSESHCPKSSNSAQWHARRSVSHDQAGGAHAVSGGDHLADAS